MFYTSVKTTTPVKRFLQILCLTVFWLFFGLAGSGAIAQVAKSDPNPAEAMRAQVKLWLAKSNGVSDQEVRIAPLDERLKVQACEKALSLDHPFASKATVRVRCVEPVWQLYLQVSFPSVDPGTAPGQAVSGASTLKTMVVARRLLQRGTILTPDLLEEVQASTSQADTQLLTSMKDVQQAELTRDMPAGQPLRTSDLRRAVLVKQGQSVILILGEKSDFQISTRMEALQDGRFGEQVKLKNPESGRQVSGVVTGPNTLKGL